MRTQNDTPARTFQANDQFTHCPGRDWIKAGGWFIKEEYGRLMDEGTREGYLLLHALGEAYHLFMAMLV